MQTLRNSLRRGFERVRTYRYIDGVSLAAAAAAYVGIVATHISTWSIWFDEAFTAYIVRFNFIDIARYTATDVHPPLYYWLVKIWVSVWGTSEFAFRSFSMVCGVIAIVLGFMLIRKLFGKSAAMLGAWLMALSPMLVRYGEEARMYMLVLAIVFAATYILVRATETNARKYWIWYGVFVALGMWTHYFAALAWIAHWVWRAMSLRVVDGLRGKKLRRAFFSPAWIWAHLLAIGMFAAWAPFMLRQLGIIQMGFWIPPVSAHTFTNYFTNILFYLDQHQVMSWLALLYTATLALVLVLLHRIYKSTRARSGRKGLLLLMSLAFAPPLLLFVASMPPLKSSFVERYLVPAIASLMLLLAVVIARSFGTKQRRMAIVLCVLLVVSFAIGINCVYHYGNYNKNSGTSIRTKELVAAMTAKAQPGEPFIATDVWVFYEAVFYTTDDHPIYFLDQTTEYKYGSVDMLKYNDQFKIKDISAFVKDHAIVWYFGNHGDTPIAAPSIAHNWKQLSTVSVHDTINDSSPYKGVRFLTTSE